MKKHFLFLLFIMTVSLTVQAQSRGVKIGYIDMEYILQNVPDYTEAKNQLEQKAQKWKQEIEVKQNEITRLKESLKTERVLLTKELIEEREEEITFQETALIEYQQKRFGPTGDLTVQKAVLAQPVQDQVFNAVQDIAEAKKYDYVFNKTSDFTMLFSAKRYDISDQVIRIITRSSRRKEMTNKQVKEEEKKEALEDMVDDNPVAQDRQKKLDEKKAAREKLVADRKAANEQRKKDAEAKRNGKKTGTTTPPTTTEAGKTNETSGKVADDKTPPVNTAEAPAEKPTDSTAVDKKKKAQEDRAKVIAERKKALEDKKKKALEEREAAKKAKEEKAKEGK
jgi:Skp family chaperone for outer membrane proteins